MMMMISSPQSLIHTNVNALHRHWQCLCTCAQANAKAHLHTIILVCLRYHITITITGIIGIVTVVVTIALPPSNSGIKPRGSPDLTHYDLRSILFIHDVYYSIFWYNIPYTLPHGLYVLIILYTHNPFLFGWYCQGTACGWSCV